MLPMQLIDLNFLGNAEVFSCGNLCSNIYKCFIDIINYIVFTFAKSGTYT